MPVARNCSHSRRSWVLTYMGIVHDHIDIPVLVSSGAMAARCFGHSSLRYEIEEVRLVNVSPNDEMELDWVAL